MKPNRTRKTRRPQANPFAKLDLRIQVSQEDILADPQYPANRAARRERA